MPRRSTAAVNTDAVRSFANTSAAAPGVGYTGFPKEFSADAEVLEPRGAIHFVLGPDDLAQFKPDPTSIRPVVLAFDEAGVSALATLDSR